METLAKYRFCRFFVKDIVIPKSYRLSWIRSDNIVSFVMILLWSVVSLPISVSQEQPCNIPAPGGTITCGSDMNPNQTSLAEFGQAIADSIESCGSSYVRVTGDLVISQATTNPACTQINDLGVLSNVDVITGSLILQSMSISTLNGLQDLDSVYGDLRITNNMSLSDVSALSDLVYIGGSTIWININPNLNSCTIPGLCHAISSSGCYFSPPNFSGIALDLSGNAAGGTCSTVSYLICDECVAADLPLELTLFNVSMEKGFNLIRWETQSEFEVKEFAVQRSYDAINWHNLAHVSAYNSQSANHYNYKDERPLSGINYYRLEMVDLDDRSEFSPVRSVNYSNDSALKIYPNPVDQELFWQAENIEGTSRVDVINSQGNIVESVEAVQTSIDVSNFAPGVYLLQVTSDNGVSTTKFIIQH